MSIKTINLIYRDKAINFVVNKKINAMKNQKIYLEHANITVNNLKAAIAFFTTAFPHFKIRGGGKGEREWVHLGDDETYLALNQTTKNQTPEEKNYNRVGINHLGFVVNNVEEIAQRLLANGYLRDYPKQIEKFRIRDYFADEEGNQYEFVQYLSEEPSERNSYTD